MIKVVKVQDGGHSLRVVLPQKLAGHLGVKAGDYVSLGDGDKGTVIVARVPDKLVIQSKPKSRARLNELFDYAERANGSIVAGGSASGPRS